MNPRYLTAEASCFDLSYCKQNHSLCAHIEAFNPSLEQNISSLWDLPGQVPPWQNMTENQITTLTDSNSKKTSTKKSSWQPWKKTRDERITSKSRFICSTILHSIQSTGNEGTLLQYLVNYFSKVKSNYMPLKTPSLTSKEIDVDKSNSFNEHQIVVECHRTEITYMKGKHVSEKPSKSKALSRNTRKNSKNTRRDCHKSIQQGNRKNTPHESSKKIPLKCDKRQNSKQKSKNTTESRSCIKILSVEDNEILRRVQNLKEKSNVAGKSQKDKNCAVLNKGLVEKSTNTRTKTRSPKHGALQSANTDNLHAKNTKLEKKASVLINVARPDSEKTKSQPESTRDSIDINPKDFESNKKCTLNFLNQLRSFRKQQGNSTKNINTMCRTGLSNCIKSFSYKLQQVREDKYKIVVDRKEIEQPCGRVLKDCSTGPRGKALHDKNFKAKSNPPVNVYNSRVVGKGKSESRSRKDKPLTVLEKSCAIPPHSTKSSSEILPLNGKDRSKSTKNSCSPKEDNSKVDVAENQEIRDLGNGLQITKCLIPVVQCKSGAYIVPLDMEAFKEHLKNSNLPLNTNCEKSTAKSEIKGNMVSCIDKIENYFRNFQSFAKEQICGIDCEKKMNSLLCIPLHSNKYDEISDKRSKMICAENQARRARESRIEEEKKDDPILTFEDYKNTKYDKQASRSHSTYSLKRQPHDMTNEIVEPREKDATYADRCPTRSKEIQKSIQENTCTNDHNSDNVKIDYTKTPNRGPSRDSLNRDRKRAHFKTSFTQINRNYRKNESSESVYQHQDNEKTAHEKLNAGKEKGRQSTDQKGLNSKKQYHSKGTIIDEDLCQNKDRNVCGRPVEENYTKKKFQNKGTYVSKESLSRCNKKKYHKKKRPKTPDTESQNECTEEDPCEILDKVYRGQGRNKYYLNLQKGKTKSLNANNIRSPIKKDACSTTNKPYRTHRSKKNQGRKRLHKTFSSICKSKEKLALKCLAKEIMKMSNIEKKSKGYDDEMYAQNWNRTVKELRSKLRNNEEQNSKTIESPFNKQTNDYVKTKHNPPKKSPRKDLSKAKIECYLEREFNQNNRNSLSNRHFKRKNIEHQCRCTQPQSESSSNSSSRMSNMINKPKFDDDEEEDLDKIKMENDLIRICMNEEDSDNTNDTIMSMKSFKRTAAYPKNKNSKKNSLITEIIKFCCKAKSDKNNTAFNKEKLQKKCKEATRSFKQRSRKQALQRYVEKKHQLVGCCQSKCQKRNQTLQEELQRYRDEQEELVDCCDYRHQKRCRTPQEELQRYADKKQRLVDDCGPRHQRRNRTAQEELKQYADKQQELIDCCDYRHQRNYKTPQEELQRYADKKQRFVDSCGPRHQRRCQTPQEELKQYADEQQELADCCDYRHQRGYRTPQEELQRYAEKKQRLIDDCGPRHQRRNRTPQEELQQYANEQQELIDCCDYRQQRRFRTPQEELQRYAEKKQTLIDDCGPRHQRRNRTPQEELQQYADEQQELLDCCDHRQQRRYRTPQEELQRYSDKKQRLVDDCEPRHQRRNRTPQEELQQYANEQQELLDCCDHRHQKNYRTPQEELQRYADRKQRLVDSCELRHQRRNQTPQEKLQRYADKRQRQVDCCEANQRKPRYRRSQEELRRYTDKQLEKLEKCCSSISSSEEELRRYAIIMHDLLEKCRSISNVRHPQEKLKRYEDREECKILYHQKSMKKKHGTQQLSKRCIDHRHTLVDVDVCSSLQQHQRLKSHSIERELKRVAKEKSKSNKQHSDHSKFRFLVCKKCIDSDLINTLPVILRHFSESVVNQCTQFQAEGTFNCVLCGDSNDKVDDLPPAESEMELGFLEYTKNSGPIAHNTHIDLSENLVPIAPNTHKEDPSDERVASDSGHSTGSSYTVVPVLNTEVGAQGDFDVDGIPEHINYKYSVLSKESVIKRLVSLFGK